MVTKEDVDKAKSEWQAVEAAYYDAAYYDAAWEDVAAAYAKAKAAADEAWEEYVKLKREFEMP